jgi:propanol-preferring alcohol dehydrogenase
MPFTGPLAHRKTLEPVVNLFSGNVREQRGAEPGDVAIVGLGGGVMSFSPGTAVGCVPWGCSVTAPFGGTRLDLMEVIALAEEGMIEAEMSCFGLDDAVSVYARLENGEIQGRDVFVPA